MVRLQALIVAGALAGPTLAAALEVAGLTYADGKLDFTLRGSGTVTVSAQADFKYLSNKTNEEALARAVSAPLRVKLGGQPTPVTVTFVPPGGVVSEVEVVVFVNGLEKARQTFYF
jgi:hypothetical protein